MWRASNLHFGLAAVALVLAGGCELIAAPDASLLGGGGGASTTTTVTSTTSTTSSSSTTTSSSSASGQGGAGGSACVPVDDMNDCTTDLCRDGAPVHDPVAAGEQCGNGGYCDGAGSCVACITASQCPGVDTTCRTRTCEMGVCGFDDAAAGTQTNTQTIGDCKREVCDGNGGTTNENDDADLPDDMNDCTDDVCTAGVPSNPPRPEDTPCGTNMLLACNATGQCVGCASPSECAGTDDECGTRTCENMVCGIDFTPAGTALTSQTDGDCVVRECDGAGNIVSTPDDTDEPADDGIACTDEVCVAGVPDHPPLPDNAPCSDGNGCTQTDTCQAGACIGADPVVCTPLDQCHDVGTCDSATGTCSNPEKPDGDPCDDATACTQDDACQAGACVGANPVVCTALDQCHDVGVCDALTGTCSNPQKPDGDACNDGDACSQSDTCQAGTCTGADPVVCIASDQCHVAGVCDPGTGTCSNPPAADGTVCSDGNACTQTDACQAGTCSGSNPVVCGPPGVCHDPGTCNPGTGTCSDPVSPDGTACTQGGQPATCTSGACASGEAEPNDVCPVANGPLTLSLNTPVAVSGAITPVADRDRFSFTLPTRGSVRIESYTGTAPGTCAGIDTLIRLKGTDCTTERGNDDDISPSNTCSLIDPAVDAFARNLPAGTYYVEVEEFGNNLTIPQYGAQILMVSSCGNTLQEVGEACDDGNAVNGDACDENCTLPACGNGVRAGAEACDDGNTSNADGCSSVCSTEVGFSCAGSPSVCTPICGDGIRVGNEQCDDGGNASGDGCSATCQIESTPEVEPNNTCVTATSLAVAAGPIGGVARGGISPVADVDWFSFTVPAFADVRIETFDNVGPLATCSGFDSEIQLFASDCTTAVGPVQDQGGIGNCSRIDPTLLAYARRLAPGTYNVRVNDFGNNDTFAAYRLQVRFAALCGNGVTEGSEQCDGGPTCAADCTLLPVCGDGVISAGEACDDSNLVSGDGCSAACQIESSYGCAGAPSNCGGICGDGTTIADEACDDGNTLGNDACDGGCVASTTTAEVEPNNTTANADTNGGVTWAGTNFYFTGAITPVGDRDLTRFVLTADSVVHFETFTSPDECASGTTTTLRILNAAGSTLYTDTTSGIRSCSAVTLFLTAGTYYLSMSESGDNGTIASYILEAKVLPVGALEDAANDTLATADGFDRPQSYVIGGHQVVGDVDTYAVFVPAGKDLRVEILEGSNAETCESNGIDSALRLLNAAGTSLGPDSDAGRGFCSLIDGTGAAPANAFASNLAAGVYFIQVTGEGTTANQQFDYRLAVMIR